MKVPQGLAQNTFGNTSKAFTTLLQLVGLSGAYKPATVCTLTLSWYTPPASFCTLSESPSIAVTLAAASLV